MHHNSNPISATYIATTILLINWMMIMMCRYIPDRLKVWNESDIWILLSRIVENGNIIAVCLSTNEPFYLVQEKGNAPTSMIGAIIAEYHTHFYYLLLFHPSNYSHINLNIFKCTSQRNFHTITNLSSWSYIHLYAQPRYQVD